jgi:hypothetical protein
VACVKRYNRICAALRANNMPCLSACSRRLMRLVKHFCPFRVSAFSRYQAFMLSVKPYLISAHWAIFLAVALCDCFFSAPGAFDNPHAITTNKT